MTRPTHSLSFFGAAGTVTGSRFLVESAGTRALIDCGLFQGYKHLRDRNRKPFPVAPGTIDALFLTHAHIDHGGYVPALVRDGYDGPVLATKGTIELLNLLLPDSAYLMEEEASYAKKKGYSKHENPKPLYTSKDAEVALSRLKAVERKRSYDVAPGISATWLPAGHIIGASSIALQTAVGSVFFSGDLGHNNDALMLPPEPFPGADFLVVESTYGNRSHGDVPAEEQLVAALGPTLEAGGVVLIPAFAVGRTQTLTLHISRLIEQGRIPNVPLFVNSPMAVNASGIYASYPDEQRISAREIEAMNSQVRFVKTVEQSMALNEGRGPMIIISAAGMLTGGRVLHHLVAFGQDPNNAIVLSGFQAGGTRGADLQAGQRTLRIFGMDIEIRASVTQIDSMSAHADADQLLAWMKAAPRPPKMTYLVHGEEQAADRLRFRIEHELGWKARAPEHGEEVDLSHPG
jgi:metallo-beta-lactamase family protein